MGNLTSGNNLRILVTGANGFLGKKLVHFLSNSKFEVHGIDISESVDTYEHYISHRVDLLDKDTLNRVVSAIQPHYIYHLAATLNRSRDFSESLEVIQINLIGTINLLNSLRNTSFRKIIYTSTSEIYGGNTIQPPIREFDEGVPASPYSLSKFCAEMAIRTFSQIYKSDFTVLRLFNFFGKDMPSTFFLSQLIEKLQKGEDFNMTHGAQKRDYVYIKDVLKALLLAQEKSADNHTFNVASGIGKSLKELAMEIKIELNSDSKINFGAIPYRDNEVWDMTGDNSKIAKILGWRPEFSFQEGLKDMLE